MDASNHSATGIQRATHFAISKECHRFAGKKQHFSQNLNRSNRSCSKLILIKICLWNKDLIRKKNSNLDYNGKHFKLFFLKAKIKSKSKLDLLKNQSSIVQFSKLCSQSSFKFNRYKNKPWRNIFANRLKYQITRAKNVFLFFFFFSFSLSYGNPLLGLGSISGEGDCLSLEWGTCSHDSFTLCYGLLQGISYRCYEHRLCS